MTYKKKFESAMNEWIQNVRRKTTAVAVLDVLSAKDGEQKIKTFGRRIPQGRVEETKRMIKDN